MPRPLLVLFDMDDVLCTYNREMRAAWLARHAGLDVDAVMARIFHSGFEAQGDIGALDSDAYLAGFAARLACDLTAADWVAARRASITPNHDVLDLARRVGAQAQVAVLTNNPTLLRDHIDELFPELRSIFGAAIFTSAQFRRAKPDPACFHACLAALDIAPHNAAFIDDLPENAAGAARAGLAAHRFVSASAWAAWLGQMRLL